MIIGRVINITRPRVGVILKALIGRGVCDFLVFTVNLCQYLTLSNSSKVSREREVERLGLPTNRLSGFKRHLPKGGTLRNEITKGVTFPLCRERYWHVLDLVAAIVICEHSSVGGTITKTRIRTG